MLWVAVTGSPPRLSFSSRLTCAFSWERQMCTFFFNQKMFTFYFFSLDKANLFFHGNNTIWHKDQRSYICLVIEVCLTIYELPTTPLHLAAFLSDALDFEAQSRLRTWQETIWKKWLTAIPDSVNAPTGTDLQRNPNWNGENTWNYTVEWLRTSRDTEWLCQVFLCIMSTNISLAKRNHMIHSETRGKRFQVIWQRVWTEGRGRIGPFL